MFTIIDRRVLGDIIQWRLGLVVAIIDRRVLWLLYWLSILLHFQHIVLSLDLF